MKDANKTRRQFLKELDELRHRISELETSVARAKRAEEMLKESERTYRTLFRSSRDALMLQKLTPEMPFILGNPAAIQMFGCVNEEEFTSKTIVDFSPEYQLDGIPSSEKAQQMVAIAREKGSHFFEFRNKRMDGTEFPANVLLSLTELEGEEVLLATVRDITDQKRNEEHIHTLTQQILEAQETGRQVISRELHDRVAQDLSLLKIGLETIFDSQAEASGESKDRVVNLSKILEGTIIGVRDLAYYLHPPGLDQLGLFQTVSQYCEDFSEKTGISVKVYSVGMEELKLPFQTAINLFRLIQEALNNIKKHSEARNVTIRLAASHPKIILRMNDDGKGFNVSERLIAALKEKRMGLRSMEERVRLIKGKWSIQSRPMEGTKIYVEIPYREQL